LSIVHGIVGQHKGWVEAESEVGKGSTFRVFLPSAAESTAVETEQSEESTALRGTETILLVEDAPKLREVIAESLRILGYRVIEAGNGQEALQRWQEHHEQVDLLFSDIIMPGAMSGLELAGRLWEYKPDLKIILSSSYSADLVDDQTLADRNLVYLRKPYNIEVMSKVIRDCFGKR
jgi:CheY-like chemotaxis protein